MIDETRVSKQTFNKSSLGRKNYDPNELDQMSYKKDFVNYNSELQSHHKTSAASVMNKFYSIRASLIYTYTKHIYTFLENICTHLPFVFWCQTNFTKFIGNQLCQSFFFIKATWKRDSVMTVFLWIL